MLNLSLHGVCFKCRKKYPDENQGFLFEDDDAHIWYCDECFKKNRHQIKTIVSKEDALDCQWCKNPLQLSLKLPFDVIAMHLDCYEKLLENAGDDK